MSPTPSSSLVCCGRSGIIARKPRWRGESSAPLCPSNWSLASFPFARQPGVNRKQIHTLAELEFVAKAENLVLIGPHRRRQDWTGVGPVAQGLGEWIPLSVHPRPGPVRPDVCLAGRPFLAPTAEPPGPARRLC